MFVSWRLVQVLREACLAHERAGVRAWVRVCAPERSRQAVSKAGESEGREHLHALCAVPAASVQDGQHVHGAMATCSARERVRVRTYAHTSERGRSSVKERVHEERAVCILDAQRRITCMRSHKTNILCVCFVASRAQGGVGRSEGARL